jgi:hypothetical protein
MGVRETEGGGESLLMVKPASALLAVVNFEDASGDNNKGEYWEVIERAEGANMSRLTDTQELLHMPRRLRR